MLTEDPSDAFVRYALALELTDSAPEESLDLWEHLLAHHADYLPAYYHAAAQLRKLGDAERALEVYDQGMTLARLQGNTKTLAELQNARTNLILGEDDD